MHNIMSCILTIYTMYIIITMHTMYIISTMHTMYVYVYDGKLSDVTDCHHKRW
jgi:hypothetical protein